MATLPTYIMWQELDIKVPMQLRVDEATHAHFARFGFLPTHYKLPKDALAQLPLAFPAGADVAYVDHISAYIVQAGHMSAIDQAAPVQEAAPAPAPIAAAAPAPKPAHGAPEPAVVACEDPGTRDQTVMDVRLTVPARRSFRSLVR